MNTTNSNSTPPDGAVSQRQAPGNQNVAQGDTARTENGSGKMNRILIGLGVIVFGLVVTDRIMEAFKADDGPSALTVFDSESQSAESLGTIRVENPGASQFNDESTAGSGQLSSGEAALEQRTAGQAGSEQAFAESGQAASVKAAGVSVQENDESLRVLQNLFGSRVVFISAAEPAYVITEDDRRIEVGGAIDDATTLAGVTAQQLIFEQAGGLNIISLPDLEMQ